MPSLSKFVPVFVCIAALFCASCGENDRECATDSECEGFSCGEGEEPSCDIPAGDRYGICECV